ncbi:MAG TPA: class I SAM-dependent methyltransferase [Terriglobales bacterium]|jgi:SAM-dependent methyltransferase|nr:class I SAM-dependent methyltransferase [Terriglobales bacterium]
MLEMAGISEGMRVLDVAAGAGGQTQKAGRRVGPKGAVLATDISSNILELAAQEARAAGLANVATRVMDGENLEIGDESFDAIISRVGLIYFPDQQRALRESRRVLRDGGWMSAVVYSTPQRNPFFSIPVSIIRRIAGLSPPAPGLPRPVQPGRRRSAGGGLPKRRFQGGQGSRRGCRAASPLGGRVCPFRARVLRRVARDARRCLASGSRAGVEGN